MANNPFAGGGSSGGSGGKRRKSRPKQDVLKTAAKLLQIKNPQDRARAEQAVGKALRGLSGRDLTRIGQKAGLDPGQVQRIANAVGSDYVKQGAPDWGAVAWPLDLLDRVTARPVKRAIVKSEGLRKPWEIPAGVYEGSVEGRSNPGLQAGIALVTGQDEAEAAKTYAGLPGYVRVPGDIAVDTGIDWTTYATFGVSAAAEAAARTAAKQAAKSGAEHAVLSPAAQVIYKKILAEGKDALSPAELRALPGAVRRRLNRAQGGARFAGIPVGPKGALATLGPKKTGGVLAALEQKLRTQGALRQAERRREVPLGTTRSVENVKAGVKGGQYLANLKPREYAKAAEQIAGKNADPELLAQVREAVDVAGGYRAINELPAGPTRDLALKLREMSGEDYVKALELGRLQPELDALRSKQAAAAAPFEPKIRRAEDVIARIEKTRYRQSGKYANALGRVEELKAAAARRGDTVAAQRAVEREAALETRAVADQVKELNRVVISESRAAQTALREATDRAKPLERGLAEIERRIKDVKGRMSSPNADVRTTAAVQLGPLETERQATAEALARAVGDIEDAKAVYGAKARVAARAKELDRPSVPGRTAPRPIRSAGVESNAARVLGREQGKLRVLENLKRSAEGRLTRTLERQDLKVRQQEVTPQEAYYPKLGAEGQPPRRPPRRGGRDITGRPPGYIEPRTNRAPASEYLDEAGNPRYELNPVVAFGRHSKDIALDETYVNAWKELQSMADPQTGVPVINLEPDAIKAFDANPADFPDFKKIQRPVTRDVDGVLRTKSEPMLVHRDIADDFEKIMDLTTRGEATQKVIDFVDNLNAYWASLATATPGFVARNVVQGNFFMGGVLAGAANPKVWIHQFGVMRDIARGVRQFGDPYRFVDAADRHIVEQAIRNNVVESSFIQSIQDLGDEATRRAVAGNWLRRSKGSPVSVNFAPLKGIRDINKLFENWSRLSVFANKMKQGYAPPEAGFITRKYMIDYTDLSPANEALRHASPFLTWTYKSVPMILGTLAKDPRKITIPAHILNAINQEGIRSEGQGVMPQWMVDAGGVTLPRALRERLPGGFGDQPQVLIGADPLHSTLDTLAGARSLAQLAKDIPFVPGESDPGAAEEFARETISSLGLGGSMGGIIQWGMETAAGREFFSGRKFEPGQKVPVPGILQPVFGKTMPWAEYNALSNTFPIVARLEQITPSNDYAKSVQGRRALGTGTGIQLYPNGPAQQRGEFYRRREILNAILKALEEKNGKVKTPSSGGGNPFGGGSSGSSKSGGNPFG